MSNDKLKLPEVKWNKNGFEIRSEVLGMAKALVVEDFHAKFAGWEITTTHDKITGNVTSSVQMPTFPGVEQVLEAAEKMYQFVEKSSPKK